jgi:hypothetical protein
MLPRWGSLPGDQGQLRPVGRWTTWAALTVLVVAAVVLRSWRLESPTLFVDEAESAINALTILQHGYPTATYLGLPIFENTLVHPWPEHPEYEFRDASYSSRGVAVFHGWLPLYSMALSFKLAGIEPAWETGAESAPGHSHEEMSRRTIAARAPAVLFGGLFVLALYAAGRVTYGRDAGLIAAAAGALASPVVRLGRQARYYSLTLLLTTLCVAVLWLMLRRGRWLETIAGAVLFVLLFHTHVLSFVMACAGWTILLPWLLRHERGGAKAVAFVGIVTAGVLPWVLLTGFLELSALPAARSLMLFPEDYIGYLARHWKASGLLIAAVAVVSITYLGRNRLPGRLAQPWVEAAGIVAFLAGWLVIGYLAFMLLVPAPSAFLWRSTLSMQGPGLVLAAVLLAAAVRMVLPRHGWVGAAVVAAGLVALPGNLTRPLPRASDVEPVYEMAEYLHEQELSPAARIYAVPYQHLPLMFYTGLPVQSVAPVRKSFLDEYPHEVLILETVFRGAGAQTQDPMWDNPAMFRGYPARDRWEFWQVFFYRFVDPATRMGENLNYADRIRDARVVTLSSSWMVYHCPPLGGEE